MRYKLPLSQNAVLFVIIIALSMAVGGLAQAALLLTGPLNLSHTGNLIQNGSFEDHPDGGVTILFWAAGTTSTPFAQPASWVTNGSPLNYAEWGNTAVFATSSAPLPDGTSGLYFGNGLMAAISQTPTFNADGSWSYVSDTMLMVRGQSTLFQHRDRNRLVKVAEPTPNPLFQIVSKRDKS